MPEKTVLAAFDRGQMPIISFLNVAKTQLGVDFNKLAAALQTFVSSHFAPIWGLPCKIQVATGTKVPAGTWALIFADDADQPGVLGYHELTPDGLPICYVFVKVSQQAGEALSVTASHEVAEMLLNPACNRWAQDHRGIFWAMEASDAVEGYHFPVDGFEMSNFVYPSAFENFRQAGSTKFDHMGVTNRPFQIAKNGYSILARGGREQQVFASAEKETAFAQEDRRMHRSESISGRTSSAAVIPTIMPQLPALLLAAWLLLGSIMQAQELRMYTQPGCGPCAEMLNGKDGKQGVVQVVRAQGVEIIEADGLAEKSIKTTPTFVAIGTDGKEIARIEGKTSAGDLRKLAALLPTAKAPKSIDNGDPAPSPIPVAAEAPVRVDANTARVELGRKLFFDPRLSINNSTSCASCHDPNHGYADGRPLAIGLINPATKVGLTGVRNTPTVLVSGRQGRQFWDGRAANLEEQALGPIANPNEMGDQTVGQVMDKLRTIPGYRTLFQQSFGRELNRQDFGAAIAAFERTLISTDAPIDHYLAGDKSALSEPAARGYALAVRSRCFDCHETKKDFRGQFANNGYSARTTLKDKGLSAAVIDGSTVGPGQNNQNVRAFKVPTLREITRTAPYMHDGGLATLADVVTHYAVGGQFNGQDGQPRVDTVIDKRVAAIKLSKAERKDLLVFLQEAFAGDFPRVEAPSSFPQ